MHQVFLFGIETTLRNILGRHNNKGIHHNRWMPRESVLESFSDVVHSVNNTVSDSECNYEECEFDHS